MSKPKPDTNAVKEELAQRAATDLRAQLLQAASNMADAMTGLVDAVRTTTAPSRFSQMTTVAELNAFLVSTGAKWYHTGGYAMLCWCTHYEMDTVETNDLDIFVELGDFNRVHTDLFGVPPEDLHEKPPLEGYKVSVQGFNGEPQIYVVDGVPLVNPEVLAKNYGGGQSASTEDKPKTPSSFIEQINAMKKIAPYDEKEKEHEVTVEHVEKPDQDEERERAAKLERRGRRKDLMGELLKKFDAEFKKK